MKTLLLLATGTLAFGYVRLQESGVYEHRTDNTNIQFYLNNQAVPGLKNSAGQTWIAANANVTGAVEGALSTWNSVATANVHFAPLQTTASFDGTSSLNVISFDESAEATEAVGGAIAVTVRYTLDDGSGVITKSDILFNSNDEFSTDLAAGTYDLQSIVTHELGHSLGADHTGTLSATMFQSSATADASQSHLAADDISFVTDAYPKSSNFGTIQGSVKDSGGNPVRGALLAAQNPATGVIVGGFSDLNDGTFSFILPPGQYQVWAQPLTGLVQAANLYLASSQVDTNFQSALAPGTTTVASGVTSHVSITAPSGTSPIDIQFAGEVPVAHPSTFSIYAGPTRVPSGQQVYFAFQATGLGSDLVDNNLSFVGPVSEVPGSIRELGANQYQITLNVPAVSATTAASMVINYKGNTASYSGGLILQPASPSFTAAGVGNVFSYSTTAVAPGEIVAIFGLNLGPAAGAIGALDSAGALATNAGGVEVTFDGTPAPVFYAGASQVNVEVPYEVAGKSFTSIVVTNGSSASGAVSLPVAASVPGLFAAAVNPDYTLNSASNPVSRGKYVTLYAVGLGALNPAVATGATVSAAMNTAAAVTASVNGAPVTPYYAGAAPGFTGLDQINVAMPSSLPAGTIQVSVTINGQASQTVSVWVK